MTAPKAKPIKIRILYKNWIEFKIILNANDLNSNDLNKPRLWNRSGKEWALMVTYFDEWCDHKKQTKHPKSAQ